MKSKGLIKSIGLVLMGSMIGIAGLNAQDTTEVVEKESTPAVVGNATIGKQYFEGSKSFKNGGPACITCHNVTYDGLIPGGLLAKDLTDVYDRMGEGIVGWLDAPPFPAMVSSYESNPLDSLERVHLTTFFKHANEVKDTQTAQSGNDLFLIGGIGGLFGILILISLLWMKRKRQMVKKDIFSRQNKAWDAKH